jgi:hypothetical protein|eukprot:scaffold5160_cov66-Cyclotella_meneghiniana.AAC.3
MEVLTYIEAIGHRIEKLIDSVPILGVPTPIQPWSPVEDTTAAMLSNPLKTLLLKWDESFSFARLLQESSSYLNNMTLRAGQYRKNDLKMEEEPLMSDEDSPIFVTSDDASVEKSVASFADLNGECPSDEDSSYEECPSVVTECDIAEVVSEKGVNVAEVKITKELSDEENDYVLAEEPESEEEDFVEI